MRGLSEPLARKPSVEAISHGVDIARRRSHRQYFWPEWVCKQKRGKPVPLGRRVACDGNKWMLMSEDDGCPAGAPRLSKICAGAAMKTTVEEGDDFGLDSAPHRSLQDPMMLLVGRSTGHVNVVGEAKSKSLADVALGAGVRITVVSDPKQTTRTRPQMRPASGNEAKLCKQQQLLNWAAICGVGGAVQLFATQTQK